MAYSDKVLEHFTHPRNMGSFKKDELGVGTGMVGAPECGDVMKLQIKVQDNLIVDAKWKTSVKSTHAPATSISTALSMQWILQWFSHRGALAAANIRAQM